MSYINPEIDFAAVRGQMQARGRVLVNDFFTPEVASALYRALSAVDWTLSHRNAQGDATLSGAELRSLTPMASAQLTQENVDLARSQFQFSFLSHSLVHAAQAGRTDLLTRFVLWMAQEEFLSAMRRLTAVESLNRVYAQATMYVPGSFLLVHDDEVAVEDRKVAYVLNLTPRWRPDWGGLLHFCDDVGNVVETFFPHFNSMSLFTVPQSHFVSYVAPFAQGERCAITGWLIKA